MRKLIVSEFISLDGVIQAPGGPEEDRSGDFRLGGWIVPYGDEAIGRNLQDLVSQPFDLLLGRNTYDIFASYWPHVSPDSSHRGLADRFNGASKHVATHRPESLAWQGSRALTGEPATAVAELKRGDGPRLVTFGSGHLVRQLLAAGLVDELRLQVFPVMLGRGKRLFGDDALASAFILEDAVSTPGGVLVTRYVRGGEVRTGTFED